MAVMHRDDMVEAAMMGDLERVDVQLQRDLPDINHVNRKVCVCWGRRSPSLRVPYHLLEVLMAHQLASRVPVHVPHPSHPLLHIAWHFAAGVGGAAQGSRE